MFLLAPCQELQYWSIAEDHFLRFRPMQLFSHDRALLYPLRYYWQKVILSDCNLKKLKPSMISDLRVWSIENHFMPKQCAWVQWKLSVNWKTMDLLKAIYHLLSPCFHFHCMQCTGILLIENELKDYSATLGPWLLVGIPLWPIEFVLGAYVTHDHHPSEKQAC